MAAKKVKRSEFAAFLNTAKSGAESWARFGKGITSQTISYNPETTQETYIDEDSGSTTLDSYAPTMDGAQTAYAGDAVFDFVDSLRKSRAVGADAETDVLLVYLYDAQADNKYAAEKQRVSIQIDDFGGDGGAPLSINYTVNFVGESTAGTVTIAEGVPTFTAT